MLSYKTECCGTDKDWVIFLHGLGGNSNIWYKQVKAFSGQFNLMFIDMFGHGDTVDSEKSYTFDLLAKGVIEVMDHAGLRSAHIVGISLGSIIADAVAFAAPDRVKSMVLGGSVLGYDLRARFLLRAGSIIKGIMPYMWLYRLFAFIMMPRKNHAFSKKVFIREAKKLGGREFKKWYRLMETLEDFYKVHAHLNVNVPRLYISGEQDHLFLQFVINAYLCDGNAAIHVIDKCGHVCNIEQADEFNRIALYYMNCYPSVPALKYVPARRSGFRAPKKPVPVHKGFSAHSAEIITFPADRRNAVNG